MSDLLGDTWIKTPVSNDNPAFVIYMGGIWKITHFNKSPDEDLRPQWGWGADGPRRSTWTIRHCFGPKHPQGHDEAEIVTAALGKDYDFANAMEVLAHASL